MKPGEISQPEPAISVHVIVINFNAGKELLACAKSVLEQGPDVCLTIVDNASSDDSLARLEGELSGNDRLRLIRNPHNPGFSKAVNQAANTPWDDPGICKAEAASHLLILNPDCVLLDSSLAELRLGLESHPQSALAGPKVLDADGTVARGTFRRFPKPWNSLLTLFGVSGKGDSFQGVELSQAAPDSTSVAEAVSGACMLVRKQLFADLGGLDEEYRLHCEDIDLMFRIDQAGFEVLYVPSARVIHLQGVSSRSRPFWVHRQKHAGMSRFYRKFQASENNMFFRSFVISGIWLHYLLTLPRVAWKR